MGEGHAQFGQQSLGFLIRLRGRNECYIHSALTNYLIVVYLREKKLFFESKVIISPAVKTSF